MPTTGIAMTGYAGVALLVIAWLVVSFTRESQRRVIAEWLGTCGMYLALLCLFASLSLRAQQDGSSAALAAFGFLVALFGSGLVVSLVQTLLALRGGPIGASGSATH
jgi:hypothetical protein